MGKSYTELFRPMSSGQCVSRLLENTTHYTKHGGDGGGFWAFQIDNLRNITMYIECSNNQKVYIILLTRNYIDA